MMKQTVKRHGTSDGNNLVTATCRVGSALCRPRLPLQTEAVVSKTTRRAIMRYWYHYASLGSLLAVLVLPMSVHAQLTIGTTVIRSEAEIRENGVVIATDSHSAAAGNVSASASSVSFLDYRAVSSATEDGVLETSLQTGGGRSLDTVPSASIAKSTWATAYTNTSSTSQTYILDFLINE